MRDDNSKLYPHITGVRGNCGEDPSVLAVTAVLDPSEHYPDEGRIILGSPTKSDKLEGYIPDLGGFSCGVEAAEQLIATLQQAVSDIRAATGKKRIGVWDHPPWLVGFLRIGRMDEVGRRSLWLKENSGSFELRAGREGEDAHVVVDKTNPLFGRLHDVLSAARFAAEYEEGHGMALSPMGIERHGFEDPDDDVVDLTGMGTTVFRFTVADPGGRLAWTEPQCFRVIVRNNSHFAAQHRSHEPDLIEGSHYYWEPVTEAVCGVSADFIMCMMMLALDVLLLDFKASDADARIKPPTPPRTTKNNVTTVDLGELLVPYHTEH